VSNAITKLANKLLAQSLLRNFAAVWGFTTERFHPDIACLFLQELVVTFYIDRRPAVFPNILSNHARLGSHSHIIVYLCNGVIYEYRWGHDSIRPFSMPLPLSCTTCGCLQKWKPTKSTQILESVPVYCGGLMEAVIQGKSTVTGCTNKLFLDLKGIHCVPTGKQGGGARGYWYGKYVGQTKAKYPLRWSYDDADVLSGKISSA
jgi:hypothetical protein